MSVPLNPLKASSFRLKALEPDRSARVVRAKSSQDVAVPTELDLYRHAALLAVGYVRVAQAELDRARQALEHGQGTQEAIEVAEKALNQELEKLSLLKGEPRTFFRRLSWRLQGFDAEAFWASQGFAALPGRSAHDPALATRRQQALEANRFSEALGLCQGYLEAMEVRHLVMPVPEEIFHDAQRDPAVVAVAGANQVLRTEALSRALELATSSSQALAIGLMADQDVRFGHREVRVAGDFLRGVFYTYDFLEKFSPESASLAVRAYRRATELVRTSQDAMAVGKAALVSRGDGAQAVARGAFNKALELCALSSDALAIATELKAHDLTMALGALSKATSLAGTPDNALRVARAAAEAGPQYRARAEEAIRKAASLCRRQAEIARIAEEAEKLGLGEITTEILALGLRLP